MGGALTTGLLAVLGGLLLAPSPGAAEVQRFFVADGYRYVPGTRDVDEAKADIGLALCGTRCNALSTSAESYLMTMSWLLTKVEGVTERVVELGNPFLDGQCVCTGEEYLAQHYYYRPGVAPAPDGKASPAGGKVGTKGAQASEAPR